MRGDLCEFVCPTDAQMPCWLELMVVQKAFSADYCAALRTVIDIHFFSILSLTFYFSIPIISIRF